MSKVVDLSLLQPKWKITSLSLFENLQQQTQNAPSPELRESLVLLCELLSTLDFFVDRIPSLSSFAEAEKDYLGTTCLDMQLRTKMIFSDHHLSKDSDVGRVLDNLMRFLGSIMEDISFHHDEDSNSMAPETRGDSAAHQSPTKTSPANGGGPPPTPPIGTPSGGEHVDTALVHDSAAGMSPSTVDMLVRVAVFMDSPPSKPPPRMPSPVVEPLNTSAGHASATDGTHTVQEDPSTQSMGEEDLSPSSSMDLNAPKALPTTSTTSTDHPRQGRSPVQGRSFPRAPLPPLPSAHHRPAHPRGAAHAHSRSPSPAIHSSPSSSPGVHPRSSSPDVHSRSSSPSSDRKKGSRREKKGSRRLLMKKKKLSNPRKGKHPIPLKERPPHQPNKPMSLEITDRMRRKAKESSDLYGDSGGDFGVSSGGHSPSGAVRVHARPPRSISPPPPSSLERRLRTTERDTLRRRSPPPTPDPKRAGATHHPHQAVAANTEVARGGGSDGEHTQTGHQEDQHDEVEHMGKRREQIQTLHRMGSLDDLIQVKSDGRKPKGTTDSHRFADYLPPLSFDGMPKTPEQMEEYKMRQMMKYRLQQSRERKERQGSVRQAQAKERESNKQALLDSGGGPALFALPTPPSSPPLHAQRSPRPCLPPLDVPVPSNSPVLRRLSARGAAKDPMAHPHAGKDTPAATQDEAKRTQAGTQSMQDGVDVEQSIGPAAAPAHDELASSSPSHSDARGEVEESPLDFTSTITPPPPPPSEAGDGDGDGNDDGDGEEAEESPHDAVVEYAEASGGVEPQPPDSSLGDVVDECAAMGGMPSQMQAGEPPKDSETPSMKMEEEHGSASPREETMAMKGEEATGDGPHALQHGDVDGDGDGDEDSSPSNLMGSVLPALPMRDRESMFPGGKSAIPSEVQSILAQSYCDALGDADAARNGPPHPQALPSLPARDRESMYPAMGKQDAVLTSHARKMLSDAFTDVHSAPPRDDGDVSTPHAGGGVGSDVVAEDVHTDGSVDASKAPQKPLSMSTAHSAALEAAKQYVASPKVPRGVDRRSRSDDLPTLPGGGGGGEEGMRSPSRPSRKRTPPPPPSSSAKADLYARKAHASSATDASLPATLDYAEAGYEGYEGGYEGYEGGYEGYEGGYEDGDEAVEHTSNTATHAAATAEGGGERRTPPATEGGEGGGGGGGKEDDGELSTSIHSSSMMAQFEVVLQGQLEGKGFRAGKERRKLSTASRSSTYSTSSVTGDDGGEEEQSVPAQATVVKNKARRCLEDEEANAPYVALGGWDVPPVIVMDLPPKKAISQASPAALVFRLIDPTLIKGWSLKRFRRVFFHTLPAFMDPVDCLDELLHRWWFRRKDLRERLVRVLELWMEEYPYEWRPCSSVSSTLLLARLDAWLERQLYPKSKVQVEAERRSAIRNRLIQQSGARGLPMVGMPLLPTSSSAPPDVSSSPAGSSIDHSTAQGDASGKKQKDEGVGEVLTAPPVRPGRPDHTSQPVVVSSSKKKGKSFVGTRSRAIASKDGGKGRSAVRESHKVSKDGGKGRSAVRESHKASKGSRRAQRATPPPASASASASTSSETSGSGGGGSEASPSATTSTRRPHHHHHHHHHQGAIDGDASHGPDHHHQQVQQHQQHHGPSFALPDGAAPLLAKMYAVSGMAHRLEAVDGEEEAAFFTHPATSVVGIGVGLRSPIVTRRPKVFAQQLTLIDAALFSRIEPQELYGEAWNKDPQGSPHVVHMIQQFNDVSFYIQSTIVSEDAAKDRAKIIGCVLLIGQRLVELQNFHGAMAVLSALSTTSIDRLKRTWAMVKAPHRAIYNALLKLFDPSANNGTYRKVLSQCDGPAIPFMGTQLNDFTMMHQCGPEYVDGGTAVNFSKMVSFSRLYEDMARHHRTAYEGIARVPRLLGVLSDIRGMNDHTDAPAEQEQGPFPGIRHHRGRKVLMGPDEIYKRSLEVEPRGGAADAQHASLRRKASATLLRRRKKAT